MVYVHCLSDSEKKELRQMTRKQVGRVAERARMILLSDQKRSIQEIAATLAKAPKNAVFLCEDESTFRLLPVIRSMWMKVGQQMRIVVPSGWNKCFRIFGALNISTGQ